MLITMSLMKQPNLLLFIICAKKLTVGNLVALSASFLNWIFLKTQTDKWKVIFCLILLFLSFQKVTMNFGPNLASSATRYEHIL